MVRTQKGYNILVIKGVPKFLTKIRVDKTDDTPFGASLKLNFTKLMKVKRVKSR